MSQVAVALGTSEDRPAGVVLFQPLRHGGSSAVEIHLSQDKPPRVATIYQDIAQPVEGGDQDSHLGLEHRVTYDQSGTPSVRTRLLDQTHVNVRRTPDPGAAAVTSRNGMAR
jgi:hypothetical protein